MALPWKTRHDSASDARCFWGCDAFVAIYKPLRRGCSGTNLWREKFGLVSVLFFCFLVTLILWELVTIQTFFIYKGWNLVQFKGRCHIVWCDEIILSICAHDTCGSIESIIAINGFYDKLCCSSIYCLWMCKICKIISNLGNTPSFPGHQCNSICQCECRGFLKY